MVIFSHAKITYLLLWHVKISCFRTQAHPMFHWRLWKHDKKHISFIFLNWALMEQVWNHRASISVTAGWCVKWAALIYVMFYIAFYHLMFFNKYFTKQIIVQYCSGLKLGSITSYILYPCNVSFSVMPTSMFLLIILLECSS